MELQQLKYFLQSSENENFSKTAEQNFVPPGTVSVAIKKLENELGCKLFERNSNKIKLNYNGRIFASYVAQALRLLDTATDELRTRQIGLWGNINLLIRTERSFVTEKMLSFRKIHPNVNFTLTHTYGKTNYQSYDLIIDDDNEKYYEFSKAPLLTENIKIAAAKNSDLCKKELKLSQLYNSKFITMSNGSSLNRLTKKFCNNAGFEANIIIETDDPLYVRRYISENCGIAFFPEVSWQNEKGDDIAFLNVTDFNFSRTTYIYFNKNRMTNAVKAFCDYLQG